MGMNINRKPPVKLDDYQYSAVRASDHPGLGDITGLLDVALGLGNEAGHVLGEIKDIVRGSDLPMTHHAKVTPEVREVIGTLLGDVLWNVALLCTELELSMNDVAFDNIKKLADRKANAAAQKGDGDNR